MKEHKKANDKKNITCKYCDENEIWKLEAHMKIHIEVNKFKCHKCSKEFQLEWRLRKHMEIHLNQ
jgi:DNA-directed RNA polymerase subunit RPC12/RpoP